MSKKSARKGKGNTAGAGETMNTEETATATDGGGDMMCTEEEIAMLGRFRAAGEDCVKELGQLEIRKARIMASYGQLEQASQNKLMEIGKRLNIEEGTAWTVKPDGGVEIHAGAPVGEAG